MTALAFGLVAAAMTITSFAAQAWKILRTREVRALATPTWVLTTAAFAVWTVYGALRRDWAILAPNAICFVLAGFILALKLMPRRRREAVADALSPR
jgi:MtN3 and saliva related transmembrane protein